MVENKRDSKIEKSNSEARTLASVTTREDGGGSPTPTLRPNLSRNHSVLGRTIKAQAIQSREADKPPDVDGALTRDFRKHVQDLLSYKSELLSHARVKRNLAPVQGSQSRGPEAALAQECYMSKLHL